MATDSKERATAHSLFLPHYDRVVLQVFHADGAALGRDVRMFADHQPAHVREKEAPGRVVRVGVRVGELVVDPVVPDPFVYVVLEGQRLEHRQHDAHRQTGFVAAVRPQPVRAHSYAHCAATQDEENCKTDAYKNRFARRVVRNNWKNL